MRYLKEPITEEVMDSLRVNVAGSPTKWNPYVSCDFCGNESPVVKYAARRMATGEYCRCWRWVACEECERLVDSDQWDAVAERVKAALQARGGIFTPRVLNLVVEKSLEAFHKDAVKGKA